MKKKYAIYTAIIGAYDNISLPTVIDNRFDYIIFSNEINENFVGIWEVKKIHYYNEDTTRIARYLKTHPDELLSDYDFTVWLDANIAIKSNLIYERSIELFEKGIMIASMDHIARDCIYDEAFAVLQMMIEHEDMIVKWCHYLRKNKYPIHNGLFETNLIYRINNSKTAKLNNDWWHFIENYSRRDQLSFNFVLWRNKLECHFFLPKETNVRNTTDFKIVRHNNILQNHCPIKNNEAWLMRYGWKKPQSVIHIKNLYYRLYKYPFTHTIVIIMGQVYRLLYLMQNIPNITK